MARRRKTNLMLVLVSVLFFISWAPLNIFNTVLDVTSLFKVNINLKFFLYLNLFDPLISVSSILN